MTKLVEKQVQYTVDQAILESAESIMIKAGITPSNLISMIYAEIARAGKIPVILQEGCTDFHTIRIIEASRNLPQTKVSTPLDIDSFLNDDSGY